MSKYTIEIKPEYEGSFKGLMILGAKDSNLFVDTLAVENLEELNSDYINEHFGSLQDDAYQRGLEKGKQTAIGAAELREKLEYQRGLNDAWKCARELCLNGACKDWFGEYFNTFIKNHTAQDAIEKLKAHKQDDKIEVGDEVETKDGKRFVVTTFGSGFDGDIAVGVCADGLGLGDDLKELRKTGRHFDIASILEEMKHD